MPSGTRISTETQELRNEVWCLLEPIIGDTTSVRKFHVLVNEVTNLVLQKVEEQKDLERGILKGSEEPQDN